jgi:hypothetical protein
MTLTGMTSYFLVFKQFKHAREMLSREQVKITDINYLTGILVPDFHIKLSSKWINIKNKCFLA